ncbi:MAG: hypothetical protein ACLPKE_32055 [Streptosporangiaceae bacterium]
MQSVTVFPVRRARDTRAFQGHNRLSAATGLGAEDELPACLLIGTWAPTTGRTLRADIRTQLLTEEDLITFWADEQTGTGSAVFNGPTVPGVVR